MWHEEQEESLSSQLERRTQTLARIPAKLSYLTSQIVILDIDRGDIITKCSKHSQGYQHTDPDSFAPEENSNDFHESLDQVNLKNVTDGIQLVILGVLAYLRLAAEAALRSTGSEESVRLTLWESYIQINLDLNLEISS